MANEIENSFEEEVAEHRHKEMLTAIKGLTKSLSSIKHDDPELRQLIAANKEAINGLTSKIAELKNGQAPEIKIDNHSGEVVKSIEGLAEIMQKIVVGLDVRLTALETRPIPTKLRPKRGYDGTIEYMAIEYKK